MGEKLEATGWWIWMLAMIVIASIVLGAINLVSKPINTAVDRVVMKNSMQYQEGKSAGIATFQAQLAQINARLTDPTLSPDVRNQMMAQKAAIEVQMSSVQNR